MINRYFAAVVLAALVCVCGANVNAAPYTADDIVPETALWADAGVFKLAVTIQVLEGLEDIWDSAHPSIHGGGSSSARTGEHRLARVHLLKKEEIPEEIKNWQPTKEQSKALHTVFKSMDLDHDGSVDRSELMSFMHKLGHKPTQDEEKIMMEEVDGLEKGGEAGKFDYGEFLMLMKMKLRHSTKPDEVSQVFHLMDKDGSHDLSEEEVRSMCSMLGEGISSGHDEELGETISQMMGDGKKINEEQFLKMAAPDGDLDTYEDDGHDDGGKITENVDEPGEEKKDDATPKAAADNQKSNSDNKSQNWIDKLAHGADKKDTDNNAASQGVQLESKVKTTTWVPDRADLLAMKLAEVREREQFNGVTRDPTGDDISDAQVHMLIDPPDSPLAAIDASAAAQVAVTKQRQKLTQQVSHLSLQLGLASEAAPPQAGSSIAPMGHPEKEVLPTAPMPPAHPAKKMRSGVHLVPAKVKAAPSPPPLVRSRPPAIPIRQTLMPPQSKPKASGACYEFLDDLESWQRVTCPCKNANPAKCNPSP